MNAYLFDNLAVALFETQPTAALDELLSDGGELVDFRINRAAPLQVVPDEVLLQWASDDGGKFERLAASIPLFEKGDEEPANRWSSKFIVLLDAAPDKGAFLNAIARSLHPTSWSGSLAAILEERRRLVEELSRADDPIIRSWAGETIQMLNQQIQHELSRERRQDESFE